MIFRLDLGQITFNLVKNVFATQQLAFLATSIAFQCIVTRAWTFLDKKVTYVFRLFDFWNFFSPFLFLLFSSLCYSDGLSTGLTCSQKSSAKASSRRAIFIIGQPGVVAGNFAPSFSLNFLSIFVHI